MTSEDFISHVVGMLMEAYAEKRAPELMGKDADADFAFIGRRMQAQVRRVYRLADQLIFESSNGDMKHPQQPPAPPRQMTTPRKEPAK